MAVPWLVTSFGFDVFGEATQAGSVTSQFDGLGRIVTRDGTSFSYSGLGQDVISDGTTTYGRGLSGVPVSSKTSVAGSLRWLVSDSHGDVIGTAVPSSGVLDSTVGFDPWGQVTGRSGTGSGSQAGFQGDWTDPSNGIVDMEARGYSPSLGMFTSRDSYGGEIGFPLSLNRFGYGAGDPINHTDPSGHRFTETDSRGRTIVSNPSSGTTANNAKPNFDFYYSVAAQLKAKEFAAISQPAAPDPHGSLSAYQEAVKANVWYRMLQIDVFFRLVALGQGHAASYADQTEAIEKLQQQKADEYLGYAFLAWAIAHPDIPSTPQPAKQTPPTTAPKTTPNGGEIRNDYRCDDIPDGTLSGAAGMLSDWVWDGYDSSVERCDVGAQLAWAHMAYHYSLFKGGFTGVNTPSALVAWAAYSSSGGILDPKPTLEEYALGDWQFFVDNTTRRSDRTKQTNLFIDIGHPDFLFSLDTIGNAIWGALTQKEFGYLLSDWMILEASHQAGNTDRGDDIMVQVGIDAFDRYGDDLTLEWLEYEMRQSVDALQAAATLPLTVHNSGSNKIVPRHLVNHVAL